MGKNIVIIGAGMAGLTCAGLMRDAGHTPLLLDKGRGIGGRMATRRATIAGIDTHFDHGAQYLTPDFVAQHVLPPEAMDVLADWHNDSDRVQNVAVPGMSSLPRAMATGLQVVQNAEVARIWRDSNQWHVQTNDGEYTADLLVLTIPAPQILPLFAPNASVAATFADALDHVQMAPCLTLMAAFPKQSPRPFAARRFQTGPLAWIAQNSTKPGRSDQLTTWVAQASPDWSVQHLENEREDIAGLMLPLLCDAVGANPQHAVYAAAHRWRYGLVAKPLAQPFLTAGADNLYLGGDWCLGSKVQDACASGAAIARAILASAHAGACDVV